MGDGVFRSRWYPRPVRGAAQRGATLGVAAASPKVETLTDDFTGTTINTTKWPTVVNATQNNVLIIPSAVAGTNGVVSATSYTLKESSIYLKVTAWPASTVNEFHIYVSLDASNYVEWRKVGNTVVAQYVTAGTPVNASGSYSDAGNPPWFRIRETAGTVYWEFSQNGTTWDPGWSAATPAWMTASSLSYVQISTFDGVGGQDLRVDNLNTAPAASVSVDLVPQTITSTPVALTITAGGTARALAVQTVTVSQQPLTITAGAVTAALVVQTVTVSPATLDVGAAPSAPLSLTAIPGNTQVSLDWNAPASGTPTDYVVQYRVKV